MPTPAPIPWNTPILQLDPATQRPVPGYLLGKDWGNWFSTSLVQQVANTAQLYPTTGVANQSGSIPTTPLPLPSLAAGLYRVTYYARITAPSSGTSSLTITIAWTDGAVACAFSGAAMTGNTTSTVQSTTLTIAIDPATPISYSTTYVSTPAGMTYKLTVLVEAV